MQLHHQTHKETLLKFVLLIGILLSYFLYMSWKYDASTGATVALLTWSFFVLCTPVADGGFILAFPIRLLFGLRMIVTQISVWIIAIGLNVGMLMKSPESYDYAFVTNLLKHIIMQPFPYWSILAISALGTFISIYFGDEMMDVTHHKDRKKYHKHGFYYRVIAIVSLGAVTILAYYYLLDSLGIKISE